MVVRVVYGGGLENRWVNSPGGSNPSPSEVHGCTSAGGDRTSEAGRWQYKFLLNGEMPERPKGTVC
jgi:hypothetical protein